jgi:hypothetical protein
MSPTVWTPSGTSATTNITYSCSGTGSCTCGTCNQEAVTINEQAPIVLTSQTLAIPAIAFHYTQNIPSNTWTIVHNLNFYPNVTVVDSAGTNVEGEIHYTDSNNLTILFTSAFSGSAYLS